MTASKDRVIRFWKLEDVDVNLEESSSEEISSDSDNPFLPHYDNKQFLEMENEFKKSNRWIKKDSLTNLGLVNQPNKRMSQGPPDTNDE